MPYIPLSDRRDIEAGLHHAETAGELNYILTSLCLKYAHDGTIHHMWELLLDECLFYLNRRGGASYTNYNTIMGALECAKREYGRREGPHNVIVRIAIQDVQDDLYRRRIAPYEDEKIKENGDVF